MNFVPGPYETAPASGPMGTLGWEEPTPEDNGPGEQEHSGELALRETADPFTIAHSAQIEEGEVLSYERTMSDDAFSREPFEREKDQPKIEPRKPAKIHPLLEQWIAERDGGERQLSRRFRNRATPLPTKRPGHAPNS